MKGRIAISVAFLFLLGFSLFAADGVGSMQYGFHFGVVKNGFETVPGGGGNPFLATTIESQVGFLGGVFYDFTLNQGSPAILLTTSVNYKMLRFKGNFVTTDTPAILGSYKNMFHCVEFPVGVKAVMRNFNGHPFFGAGLQMDVIAVDTRTIDGVSTQEYDTIPAYNNRFNSGIYLNGGFEIPSSSHYYCFEIRYIHWSGENFSPSTCFFTRNKSEIQFMFGLKFR